MEIYSLEEVMDSLIGPIGSPIRTEYELSFKREMRLLRQSKKNKKFYTLKNKLKK